MAEQKTCSESKVILFTIMIGAFMSMFDGGVVNVGLPTIAKEFKTDMSAVQWIASIYLLIMSALLPILGMIADNFGRRRMYNAGFLVISVFTLTCGFASSLGMLIVMRIMQAIGGAMVMANGLAIATENYPSSQRGRNIGLLATTLAIGSIAGPPAGGFVIGLWGWRSVFFLTFIVSFIGFIASYFTIPRDKKIREEKFRFDFLGSFLLVLSIITFIFGLSNVNTLGWSNPVIFGSLIICAISTGVFLYCEKRKQNPVINLKLFNNWTFTASILASLISFITMFSPTVLLPFYYQEVLGLSAETTGLYLMAFPIAMALVSTFSGALSDKIGSSFLTSLGLVINGIALVLLANITLNTSAYLILFYVALMGLSLGLFQSPNNSCIMGSVPKNELGAASGITQLIKNIGMVIGIAFSVALFSAFTDHHTANYAQNFINGTQKVYICAAVLSLIGAVISALRNRKNAES